MGDTKEIFLKGMQGLGDNLHQRAVVDYYIRRYDTVYLETPWPQVYYDKHLVPMLPEKTTVRTSKKNVTRSINPLPSKSRPAARNVPQVKIWYTADQVRKQKSILGAMLFSSGVPLVPNAYDFSFNVPAQWVAMAREFCFKGRDEKKPVLFYRALNERTEWAGCANRNPDIKAYETLINYIKEQFFVVSVADLQPGTEWLSGGNIDADLKLHSGELSFEMLCGLMHLSDLAFCSPGFAVVMAQAIGTPSICVYGGRESSQAYALGAQLTPSLGIDTEQPCMCFDHNHNCVKTINIERAKEQIDKFIKREV